MIALDRLGYSAKRGFFDRDLDPEMDDEDEDEWETRRQRRRGKAATRKVRRAQ